jgi:hypothetical protein
MSMVSSSRADGGDRFDTGVSAEIGDQGVNLNVRERGDELFESIAATANDQEVVPVGPEASRKGLIYAGGCAGNECQPYATVTAVVLRGRRKNHVGPSCTIRSDRNRG